MAVYIKTIKKGIIRNSLCYRGHWFKEIWEKDILWEYDKKLEDKVKEVFEETTEEEINIIKSLSETGRADTEIEEAICRLTELEEQYAYSAGGGSSQKERSGQQATWKEHLESRFGKVE